MSMKKSDLLAIELCVGTLMFLLLCELFGLCLYMIVVLVALVVCLGLIFACAVLSSQDKINEEKQNTWLTDCSMAVDYDSAPIQMAEAKSPRKKSIAAMIMSVLVIISCVSFCAVCVIGRVKESKSRYGSTRNFVETEEIPIVAMGENTSIHGGRYYIRSEDNYVVMQQTENGGYQKNKYPCYATTLFETDASPCAKRIITYAVYVLTVSNKWFVCFGETMGENLETKRVSDVQYEIYVPKGTVQELPSMEIQFEGES